VFETLSRKELKVRLNGYDVRAQPNGRSRSKGGQTCAKNDGDHNAALARGFNTATILDVREGDEDVDENRDGGIFLDFVTFLSKGSRTAPRAEEEGFQSSSVKQKRIQWNLSKS
jgi:hypothetical protein